MSVSETTYQLIALEDPEGQWELHRGRLLEKPSMSVEHNDLMFYLGMLLQQQLDRREFRLRVNGARVRHLPKSVYIPDVAVIPLAMDQPFRGQPGMLEIYNDPLPFVAEVWSPSTGDYDVDTKIPEYKRRGDAEIWRLHPYNRTLTAWRRQGDGSYTESVYQNGIVPVVALPGVTIDLDALFE